jgi:1,4-alpha-glucan branching enzyme
MSIKKQYLKKDPLVCKVDFKIVKGVWEDAETVKIVGDFNNWDMKSESMKKLKNGSFTQSLKLNPGKEYQFRYLVNDKYWENDPEADKFIPNGINDNETNSVLVL